MFATFLVLLVLSAASAQTCTSPCSVMPYESLPTQLTGFCDVTGKVALVTGATSGNGLAVAQLLHDNGATVVGTSRNPNMYEDDDFPWPLMKLDYSRENTIKKVVRKMYKEYERIDIFVENGARITIGNMLDGDASEFRQYVDEVMMGKAVMVRMILQEMPDPNHAITLVPIVSTASNLPLTYPWSLYSFSKAGYRVFLTMLFSDMKQRHPNARMSLLHPGLVNTDIAKKARYLPEDDPNCDVPVDLRNITETWIAQGMSPDRVGFAAMQVICGTDTNNEYFVGSGPDETALNDQFYSLNKNTENEFYSPFVEGFFQGLGYEIPPTSTC